MEHGQTHIAFVRQLGVAFLASCALVAAVNYAVDPYALFGTPRVAGFNARKPAAAERVRVSKPYMASAATPRTVIAGNSRPELGLDPRSACWPAEYQPVFNSGIPGAGFHMQARYAMHALAAGEGDRVFMGVDFSDFLVDGRRQRERIDWRLAEADYIGRLSLPDIEEASLTRIAQTTEDRFKSLVSLGTLIDSISTILGQGDRFSSDRRTDGFNPGDDYIAIVRTEGQHVLFAQKNRDIAASLSRPHQGLYDYGPNSSADLEALRKLLREAAGRGVDVVLFINPYHTHYLAQIEFTGKWPLFEQWKRELVRIADEYDVPLWDFNTADAYASETPPPPGDRRSELVWYWEPAHYKREMGELMIQKMTGGTCENAHGADAPGIVLTPATIDAHLRRLREDLAAAIAAAPDEYERLRRLGTAP